MDLARGLELPSLEADSLEQLAHTCVLHRDYECALRLAEQALAVWDRLGDV